MATLPLMILSLPVAWFLYALLTIPWLMVSLHRSRGFHRLGFALVATVILVRPVPLATFALLLGILLEATPDRAPAPEVRTRDKEDLVIILDPRDSQMTVRSP